MSAEHKTILEHLQTLPPDHPKYGNIREKTLAKYDPDYWSDGICAYKGDDLLWCLVWAFDSVNTPEGKEYWVNIQDEIEAGTLFDYQKPTDFYCEEGITWEDDSPWISVKDRLPDAYAHVYVSEHGRGAGGHAEAQLIDDEWYGTEPGIGHKLAFIPTHWLPKSFIPEPPKE